jgi:non-heme chloroperoxidase
MRILIQIAGCLMFAACSFAQVKASSETFRTSDNVTLHYLQAGPPQAPALVLIPGWTMPADIFEPQINELSKRFHVVALDPRSQGDSEKTPEGNYPERHARDINELLQHLKLTNVVLLGWSNGVPDVLSFVEQNGDGNLRGLILVDGLVNFSDPAMARMMSGMLKNFQTDRAKFTDGFVRGMYATKQSEEYIQHVEQAVLKTPTNSAVTEMFNVLMRVDYTPILAKVNKPVLYLCEPYLEAQGKLVQAALPGARVEVFKNANHALFVDDAEHFNQVVGEFIDAANAPSAH